MPTKGTYTALQKLQPINIDWGEVAETGNKRADLLYTRKTAEESARKEERDKIDYDTLEPVITGIDSLDKGLTLGIQEASTLQHQDYKQALNDPAFADSPEYKIRTKNLNNYSKNVKTFTEGFSKLAESAIAKANDGTLSEWDNDLLSTLNGGFVSEKVKFGVSKDGGVEAYVASTDQNAITDENPDGYVYDEDGKIKMTKVTPNEVFKGLGKFSITPEVDIQKQATNIGKELGKSIKSDVNGYLTTSEQSWENRKDDAKNIVRGLMGSPKYPTALTKRMWADEMGMESRSLTEEDMTLIEEKLLEKVKPFYDEEMTKRMDFGAQEAARTRAEKSTKDTSGGGIQLEMDTSTGKPLEAAPSGVYGDLGGGAYSFTMPVVKDKKGLATPKVIVELDGKPTSIETLYLTKSGKVAYKGFYSKGRESGIPGEDTEVVDGYTTGGSKVTKNLTGTAIGGGLNETQLNKVARGLGFNNSIELKKHLESVRDSYVQNNKQSSAAIKGGKSGKQYQ